MSAKKVDDKSTDSHGDVFSFIGRMLRVKSEGANILSLLGGEPTISDKLTSLLFIANSIGFENVIVHTNGMHLDEKLLGAFKKNRVNVKVSIYGITDLQGDRVMSVDGAQSRVKKNINKLLLAGIPVHLCFIGDTRQKDIPLYLNENFSKGSDDISYSIHPVIAAGRGKNLGTVTQNEKCCCDNNLIYYRFDGKRRNCVFDLH
ncbi:hypothetical protein RJ45_22975 [Photobacterium gaetbulicola]|uniref:Radical SAM core domain-containing protein n=2 Tax=Photobacterium gaetbulicola TaxID=1295392 RepID=A0A0B9GW37_9GAMM|nr:hypothetical protein RJ45_22975 [Photobacterium gaetbulicola]